MDWATFVKKENVRKAEEKLKSDFNLAAKQSIAIRDAKSLEIEKDGSFFLVSGTEEGVAKCKVLIKDLIDLGSDKWLKHKFFIIFITIFVTKES